jgi:hypothetical protein
MRKTLMPDREDFEPGVNHAAAGGAPNASRALVFNAWSGAGFPLATGAGALAFALTLAHVLEVFWRRFERVAKVSPPLRFAPTRL